MIIIIVGVFIFISTVCIIIIFFNVKMTSDLLNSKHLCLSDLMIEVHFYSFRFTSSSNIEVRVEMLSKCLICNFVKPQQKPNCNQLKYKL